MEAMGVTNANSKIGDTIAVNSRDYKEAIDRSALFAKWQKEMDERGFTADKVADIRDVETEPYPEALPLSAVLDSLIEDKAVFRLQDIYAEVAKEAQYTHSTVQDIEDTVRREARDRRN